ncbi:MAG: PBP1A family penicillin-binding protein [Firmicutes bacterium]|nr:PBP1A family penicillin-binding protein [Bacillota bacterium]
MSSNNRRTSSSASSKTKPTAKKNNKYNGKKSKKRTILKIFIGFLTFAIIMAAGGIIYLSYLSKTLPSWDESAFDQSTTSKIYDMDDSVVSMKFQNENRTPIPYSQMSPDFIEAILATEDADFYNHNGFSIKGIIRSTFNNLITTGRPGGASTITQQLARGVLLVNEDTTSVSYVRKIREILLAMQIEDRLTKEEILTNYVNTIPYGHGAYGVEAAAITYFDKSAKDLTLIEAALLAGLPQAPSNYDPFKYPEAALARRNIVLDRLVAVGYITKKEATELKKTPITLKAGVPNQAVNEEKELANYQYFIDYVTSEADEIISSKNLESIYNGGYKIYTTLDTNVQSAMETVYNNDSLFPQGMGGSEPESAMVVVDQSTGAIRGMVGGRSYTVEMGFNRAVSAQRSPGSTFKPIVVYGPAFEKGVLSPSMIVKDTAEPKLLDGNGEVYDFKNYSGTYVGNVTVRTAVKNSINTVAVRVLNEITPRYGYDFALRLGITNLSANEKDNLSMALGGLQNGVTPLEMARAFGVFGNNGVLVESNTIRRIEDSFGNLIYESKPKSTQAISPEVAYMVNSVLIDVVDSGTGTNAKLYKREIAGKTGTTDLVVNGVNKKDGNGDLWFVGYTPQLSAAVWIGYDKNSSTSYLQKSKYGSGKAAYIWSQVMKTALQGEPYLSFTKPSGIIEMRVDPITGLPTTETTSKKDIFIKGLLPTKASSTLNLPTEGKAVKSGTSIKLTWEGLATDVYTIYRIDAKDKVTEIAKRKGNTYTDTEPKDAKAYRIKSADGEITISL